MKIMPQPTLQGLINKRSGKVCLAAAVINEK